MRLTSLQEAAFDLNLYVFTNSWINDRLNAFGFHHQGLTLRFRDFDTPTCVANAGKWYAEPAKDSYLSDYAPTLGETAKLFQKLSRRGKFYLTNIQAHDIQPAKLRQQRDDLWMFPYYTAAGMVPYDAALPASRTMRMRMLPLLRIPTLITRKMIIVTDR